MTTGNEPPHHLWSRQSQKILQQPSVYSRELRVGFISDYDSEE